jgi:penicillin V acylase-like amidase (Ntn superfamily)
MTNSTYYEKIVDITTGEETIRPYTEEEIAQLQANKILVDQRAAEIAAKEAEKNAVFAKLGLTPAEATLLLG